MIESWWKAHELEVVITLVVLGALAVLWLFASLSDAWEERKRKKKDGIL